MRICELCKYQPIRIVYSSVSVRVLVCVMLWSVNQGVTQHLHCPLLACETAAECWARSCSCRCGHLRLLWSRDEIYLIMSGCRGGRVIHWASICSLWQSHRMSLCTLIFTFLKFSDNRKKYQGCLCLMCCLKFNVRGRGWGKEALCKLIHGNGLTRKIVTWAHSLASYQFFQIAGSMPSSLDFSSSHSFLSILDFSLKEVLIGSFYLVISGNTF